jgi:hypothetical protein
VDAATVFLLSPASCAGRRAKMLLNGTSPLATRLASAGAPLGEVFTFMSSLYFRGKLTYANTFGAPPPDWPGTLVIAPGFGLVPADLLIRSPELRAMAAVPVDHAEPNFYEPLVRDALVLDSALGANGRAVLLGSVASEKYVTPLVQVFGDRLYFPACFVGRGDMSRGGLMLRCARSREPLECVPVRGAVRRGQRPPKLGAVR